MFLPKGCNWPLISPSSMACGSCGGVVDMALTSCVSGGLQLAALGQDFRFKLLARGAVGQRARGVPGRQPRGDLRAAFHAGPKRRGFGLRAVSGEAAGYAHAGELSDAALARAASAVKAVRQGRSGTLEAGPRATNARLYVEANPLAQMDFAAKTALLAVNQVYHYTLRCLFSTGELLRVQGGQLKAVAL
jgi:hypothetical protein